MLSSLNAIVPMACVTAAGIAAMTAETFRAPGERMPIAPLGAIGLTGAAVASLIGYTVMLLVALMVFARKRRLSLWVFLRPQLQDFTGWQSLRRQAFAKRSAGPQESSIRQAA